MPLEVGVIIGAILTIFVFSFPLYKESIMYRFAEYTMIGISLGMSITVAYKYILDNAVTSLIEGQYVYLVVIIFSLLIFFTYTKHYKFLYRWPMAIIIGFGLGVAVRGIVHADIIQQIAATVKPIPMSGIDSINSILQLMGVVCTILYFVMTLNRTGRLKGPIMFGRYWIMIALGVQFGNTVMTRNLEDARRYLNKPESWRV